MDNPNIGRRTGVDVLAGKNIRILQGGYENFDDYWTDSEDESVVQASFNKWANKENHQDVSTDPARRIFRADSTVHSMSSFSSAVSTATPAPRHLKHDVTDTDDTNTVRGSPASRKQQGKTTKADDPNTKTATPGSSRQPNNTTKVDPNTKRATPSSSRQQNNTTNTATINEAGEITGTITRDDSKANLAPSSAIHAFRTRKRLTYSGEDVSDQSTRNSGVNRMSVTSQYSSRWDTEGSESETRAASEIETPGGAFKVPQQPKRRSSRNAKKVNLSVNSSPDVHNETGHVTNDEARSQAHNHSVAKSPVRSVSVEDHSNVKVQDAMSTKTNVSAVKSSKATSVATAHHSTRHSHTRDIPTTSTNFDSDSDHNSGDSNTESEPRTSSKATHSACRSSPQKSEFVVKAQSRKSICLDLNPLSDCDADESSEDADDSGTVSSDDVSAHQLLARKPTTNKTIKETENESHSLENHKRINSSEAVLPRKSTKRTAKKQTKDRNDLLEYHESRQSPAQVLRKKSTKRASKRGTKNETDSPDHPRHSSPQQVLPQKTSGRAAKRQIENESKTVENHKRTISSEELLPKKSTRRGRKRKTETKTNLPESQEHMTSPQEILPKKPTRRATKRQAESETNAPEYQEHVNSTDEILPKKSTRRTTKRETESETNVPEYHRHLNGPQEVLSKKSTRRTAKNRTKSESQSPENRPRSPESVLPRKSTKRVGKKTIENGSHPSEIDHHVNSPQEVLPQRTSRRASRKQNKNQSLEYHNKEVKKMARRSRLSGHIAEAMRPDNDAVEYSDEENFVDEDGVEDIESEDNGTDDVEPEDNGTEDVEPEDDGKDDVDAEDNGTENMEAELEDNGTENTGHEDNSTDDVEAEDNSTDDVEAEDNGTEDMESEPGTDDTEHEDDGVDEAEPGNDVAGEINLQEDGTEEVDFGSDDSYIVVETETVKTHREIKRTFSPKSKRKSLVRFRKDVECFYEDKQKELISVASSGSYDTSQEPSNTHDTSSEKQIAEEINNDYEDEASADSEDIHEEPQCESAELHEPQFESAELHKPQCESAESHDIFRRESLKSRDSRKRESSDTEGESPSEYSDTQDSQVSSGKQNTPLPSSTDTQNEATTETSDAQESDDNDVDQQVFLSLRQKSLPFTNSTVSNKTHNDDRSQPVASKRGAVKRRSKTVNDVNQQGTDTDDNRERTNSTENNTRKSLARKRTKSAENKEERLPATKASKRKQNISGNSKKTATLVNSKGGNQRRGRRRTVQTLEPDNQTSPEEKKQRKSRSIGGIRNRRKSAVESVSGSETPVEDAQLQEVRTTLAGDTVVDPAPSSELAEQPVKKKGRKSVMICESKQVALTPPTVTKRRKGTSVRALTGKRSVTRTSKNTCQSDYLSHTVPNRSARSSQSDCSPVRIPNRPPRMRSLSTGDYQESPVTFIETPTSVPRSILKRSVLPRYSTGSPLHYFEMTGSVSLRPDPKTVKIISPESKDGLRRSQRTRVKPLDWYRNERILYEKRKSGGFTVAGIISPVQDVSKRKKLKQAIRNQEKGKAKRKPPPTPRNLSIHTEMPRDAKQVENAGVVVINPDSQEEVLVECVKTKDDYYFWGPNGDAAKPSDPLVICKAIREKAFSVGELLLRPLQEKGMQYVKKDTMVFVIKYGKLAVTIHRTTTILEADDMFYVPNGNTYSLKNLREEEAKLWFFQSKG